ncbi:MAG TPA: hypothetical protein VFA09_01460 [Ktedonobacteraceae bacterium]|nr:hypothetical protein [Ktedonobacteraceae bacterium]
MSQTRTPNMTDYEAERRNFSLEVPEYFNFAIDVTLLSTLGAYGMLAMRVAKRHQAG